MRQGKRPQEQDVTRAQLAQAQADEQRPGHGHHHLVRLVARAVTEWLTSLDHKRIGIMYVTLALIMLLRGFVDAIMMRAQQAIALNEGGYLPPDHFDQIFSSHGTIMIFFMAMPFLTGLINIVVPQQIGTRDVAFPFSTR